jgi:hypothetical protein
MVWITKDGNRVKLAGEYILKVNGKEVDSFSTYEEAKKEADRQGGEVWHNNVRVYSSQLLYIEEPQPSIKSSISLKKSKKPNSIVKKNQKT